MTFLFGAGKPVDVHVDGLQGPIWFVWQGRAHVVEQIANRWRVDTGWWRLRVWREYFKVTTDTGLLAVIYHNLLTGEWYIQRVYD